MPGQLHLTSATGLIAVAEPAPFEYECAVCHKGKRDRIMLYPVHDGPHCDETLCTQCVLDNGGNAILHDPTLR